MTKSAAADDRITEKLAQFVTTLKFNQIPAEAIRLTEGAIIDCMGGAIAACNDPISAKIAQHVKAEGAKPISGVIGSGFRTSAQNAALANGTIAHVLDLDDTNESMRGHPSVPVVPAIMALGEELHSPGEKIITSYICGLEVEAKIGRGINLEHYEKGWHTTLTLGSLGSAMASAKMLDLDLDQTKVAMGIAATLAGGLRANFGTMTKPFHAGKAAQNGVMAAKLAQIGFTANKEIIETSEGFCHLFCGPANVHFQNILSNLGNPLEIINRGVIYKLYPSCSLTHPAIDMILELKKQGLAAEAIASIRCGTDYRWITTLPFHLPRSGLQGKFSMEYCIAVSILKGKTGIEEFTDEIALQPEMESLMRKIELYTHPKLKDRSAVNDTFTFLEITLKNGQKIERQLSKPKGHPLNPLSWNELLDKYTHCAQGKLTQKQIDRSLNLFQTLEHLDNIDQIMTIICKT